MQNVSSRKIAFIGVVSALVFTMLTVESYLLSGLFEGFNPAILSIPLTLSLCLFAKDNRFMFFGTVLGVCSMIIGCMLGFYEIWLNPLISLFPRVMMGVTARLTYKGFEKAFSGSDNKFLSDTLPLSLGVVVGCITNTVLVLTMMWLFGKNTLAGILSVIISLNTPVEILASAVIVPLIVGAERKVYKEN